MSLRFRIDMNLSPAWVEKFVERGWPAVHWSGVGDPRAPDTDVMAHARTGSYVVFTHDLDFGTILATTSALGPSVIQARTQDVTPEAIGPVVFAVVQRHASDLERGALITIDASAARVRILPLTR